MVGVGPRPAHGGNHLDQAITAHASDPDGPQAARACLDQLHGQTADFKGYSLGVIYVTDPLAADFEEIVVLVLTEF